MPIVGFNLEKTQAERSKKLQKGMKATHNITITSINNEDIEMGKNSKKLGLKFSFEFNVDYQPEVGKILIGGSVLYLDDEKTVKEILNGWKKNRHVNPEIAAQILNTAIVRCTIKALNMAQEVNLPPHMPIPTVTPRGKEQDYIG
ncbi:hypothetical protein HYT56_04410 [Candidatus Woesearchaeota archaeon]|nr:hypothetical protein [Candidatus Woesearchaeota archaeon]